MISDASQPPQGGSGDYPDTLQTILDSLDALVYVSDLETYELLYLNAYGRQLWGEPQGRKCWQVLQAGQAGPCSFCTNDRLVDDQGHPTGVYVWEFQNTDNQRWYQCRDLALRWTDGRLVRLEVAIDITDRKETEEQLRRAVALAEARANTDELTGLNNRRAFFALGEQATQQALRNGHPLSLIMFDLDHFKQINDSYGHAIGDRVLQNVATKVDSMARDADVLGRIGGEEFAILMYNTDTDESSHLAERLRQAIAASTIEAAGQTLGCTASFGIAAAHGRPISLEHLLSEADHAMYRAKSRGRNRVETAGRPSS
ncbi:GGDEF domain-containing protein [Marinobacter mobilis]|uniref:diguanylate cyclase n=1 Tax=Marinobacter mobilis TaxID=488533 RepID=A0A1H2QAR2_9GAMM|nr:GGDEF domain-containing protein [Marinobacter mobilis]SDW03509.1 diguanylate cyclase [Marinobacter mobilis]